MLIGKQEGIRTPEFNKKMERRKLIRQSILGLFIILVIGVPIYLLRTSRFLISSIQVMGNNVTKSEEIQKIISDNLAGNYLFIFPKSNAILYPKKKIENDLLLAEARLYTVKQSLIDPSSLKVEVTERKPLALYCKNVSNVNAPTGCFFLDASGYIFSEAPSFTSGVYSVYASDPSLDPPLRHQYLDAQTFSMLDPFIKSLAEASIYPKVFLWKGDEYKLKLSNGGDIIWKTNQDLDKVQSNLLSFLEDQNFKKVPGALDNLLYIDLRFGNKVFYKFRDGGEI